MWCQVSKYRGSDGWLHDDGVDPQRYENVENVQPAQTEKKKYSRCPNCDLSITWRREEGLCTHCGWGKIEDEEGDKAFAMGCLVLVGLAIVCPLVGMGIGYGIGGFGGLVVGFGLGIAVPIAVLIVGINATRKGSK